MAWAGTAEDLADWLAANDDAIVARDQQRRRAVMLEAGGEIA